MVLPIGFFAPLPLPMMIPFMGIQSAVMAEQFGTLFQYGKRRISAMSNEEFNKLTPEILQERMTRQIEGMIPEMEKQIQAMSPLVKIILKEFGNYILLAGEAIAEGVGSLIPPPGEAVVTGGVVSDPAGVLASDVFKTTTDVDMFDVNRTGIKPSNQVPRSEWSAMNVYHDVWTSVVVVGAWDVARDKQAMTLFFGMIGKDAAHVVIQKTEVIHQSQSLTGGVNNEVSMSSKHRFIFYID